MKENTKKGTIPVIIPAYEPDDRMIALLKDFEREKVGNVIIVDDGSGEKYDEIFSQAQAILERIGGVILRHDRNRGKGRALKTAFSYVLENQREAAGAVTADSDGQHTVECIKSIIGGLEEHPDALVLGVRKFDGEDIPWKSRFGNNLTLKVLKLVSGLDVQDTQTGLRGIPKTFMKELLEVEGERFEFEMRMLLETIGKYEIVQIPIRTVYDSRENHQTHFDPVADSIKIYRILIEKFIRYVFSALSSFILDIALFTLFCYFTKKTGSKLYITYSTVLARVISSVYNYLMNYKFVFRSREKGIYAASKYFTLAVLQMMCSALFVTIAVKGIPALHETPAKIIVDTILFFISYQIQKKIVFRS